MAPCMRDLRVWTFFAMSARETQLFQRRSAPLGTLFCRTILCILQTEEQAAPAPVATITYPEDCTVVRIPLILKTTEEKQQPQRARKQLTFS